MVGTVVLYVVDEPLRMLYAHTHSERLGLEQPAVAVEELVDVAGRMACGKHNGFAFDSVAAGAEHSLDAVAVGDEAFDSVSEVYLSAIAYNRLPHTGDDAAQAVGAYMCVGINHYLGVGTVLYKALQHVAYIAALGGACV